MSDPTPERLTLPDPRKLVDARIVWHHGYRLTRAEKLRIHRALDVVEYLGREDVQEALRAMAAHFEGGWRVPGHPYAALVRPLLYDREAPGA